MSLFTNLGNAIRLSRSTSYAPSELVDEPRNQTNTTSKKKCNPYCYLIMIGILSGLLTILITLFVLEFINNKDMMNSLEQMQPAVTRAENLKKLMSFKHLGFIWDLCNRTTLQCSHCLPGWKEHASRCFLLSNVEKNWENARRECLHYKGDLAVVQNAEDQAFLTNMTFQVKKANPNSTFHSAWIGLQDLVKEGRYSWVNGDELKLDVRFWRPGEPNNAIAGWVGDNSGQDCVSILPPDDLNDDWMKTWDDIICIGKRNYICETEALILT